MIHKLKYIKCSKSIPLHAHWQLSCVTICAQHCRFIAVNYAQSSSCSNSRHSNSILLHNFSLTAQFRQEHLVACVFGMQQERSMKRLTHWMHVYVLRNQFVMQISEFLRPDALPERFSSARKTLWMNLQPAILISLQCGEFAFLCTLIVWVDWPASEITI